MLTTARLLLFLAAIHAALAGFLWALFPSLLLLLFGGVLAMLAWSAYLLHRRDNRVPRPPAPLTSWRDGQVPR